MSQPHTFHRGGSRRYSLNDCASIYTHPVVLTWSNTVIAAGGSIPSNNTLSTLSTFYNGLVSNNLIISGSSVPYFKSLNCFVPDSLTAAITPLISNYGSSSWKNYNLISTDLSLMGIIGNASNKYLNTGVIPSTAMTNTGSGGLTAYCPLGGNNNTQIQLGVWGSAYTDEFDLYFDFTDANSYFDCYGAVGGRIHASNTAWSGFLSGNRISKSSIALYKANSLVPFTTVVSGTTASDQGLNTLPIYCMATDFNGTATDFIGHTISFAAIHEGFTSGQCQTLFNLVQAMRKGLGGGWI